MKHFKITILFTLFISMIGAKAYAHDIEIANTDGIIIYYIWTNNNTELSVSYKGNSYPGSNSYSGNIVIPESVLYQGNSYRVTSVDQHAFEDCSGLTSVTIPNSVTKIGYEAFRKCTGLTSIIIPQNVTRIDQEAFYSCSNLASVSVLNSETSIGESAFEYSAWEKNQPDGIIYIGKVLYKYKGYIPENTNVTIKAGTVEISDLAFWSSVVNGLSSITIPNSVRKIGSKAFYNCNSLTSIDIPSSVTSIGGNAFEGTAWYNNQHDGLVYAGKVAYKYKGTMPDNTSIIIQEGTTEIAGSAFEDCTGLNSIVLPNSVTKIGKYAFDGCNHLQSIVIPEGVTEIEAGAFYDCTNLISVSIPSSMIKIGGGVFRGCSMLNKVIISDISSWCNIIFGYSPFDYEHKHQLYFSNGSIITDLIIPDGVKRIGNYFFYGCYGLTSITIPNSVTSIGNYAFCNCSGLTSVTIPNSVTSIGDYAFYACSGLTSVTIPNSVTSIGSVAFQNCSGLTSVTIPNSVTSIDRYTFCNCSGLTSVTIPNSVTSIGESAFKGCSGLTSVTIPNSVTSIGDYAFSECGLATIVSEIETPFGIGEIGNNSVTLIVPVGTKAAYQSTAGWSSFTKTVEVGEGGVIGSIFEIDGIYYKVGENNTASLSSTNNSIFGAVTIPSQVELNGKTYDVTSISGYTFEYCSGLISVTIPNSVTSIGDYAFEGCSSLTSVTIPNSVTFIGNYAFEYCSGLTSVTIPNSVTSIGRCAFQVCSGLTSVTIGSGATSIGQYAFSYCSELKDVYCFAEQVPTVELGSAFFKSNIGNATLHIPSTSINAFKNVSPWKNFKEIVEIENGNNGGKCATPTISQMGDKLKFSCETEGVSFCYQITPPPSSESEGEDVSLPTTYTVTVYAKKDGYENSDLVTKVIDVRGLEGDVNQDGVVNVADHVKLSDIILNQK